VDITKVTIYCFTGTGNTLLVAQEMLRTFAEKGLETHLFRMERADPARVPLDGLLGLAFPVAGQTTFPLVWRFARALPSAQGTPIFMVDTMMAFSGGVVGPLRRVVEKKGYRPIGAQEIVMPNNFSPLKIDEEKNRIKITRGLAKAQRYAQDLLDGRVRWGHVPVLPDLLYAILGSPFLWRISGAIGQRFVLEQDKCSRCGLCEELCPLGNISLDPYPQFGPHCQLCQRCIAFCPTEAIHLPWLKHERYRAVRAAEILELP